MLAFTHGVSKISKTVDVWLRFFQFSFFYGSPLPSPGGAENGAYSQESTRPPPFPPKDFMPHYSKASCLHSWEDELAPSRSFKDFHQRFKFASANAITDSRVAGRDVKRDSCGFQ